MASLNEIAYNVINAVSGGKSTNNDTLSTRQVKHLVKQYRAMLIRRQISGAGSDRRGAVGMGLRLTEFEQDIDLYFKVVPRAEQGELGAKIHDRVLLRSTTWISPPIRLRRELGFTYIGTMDDATHFKFVNIARVNYMEGNTFTARKPLSFYSGRYIYILDPSDQEITQLQVDTPRQLSSETQVPNQALQYLYRVRGVFEDPGAIFLQAGYDYTDDSDYYPVPLDFAQQLTDAIINGEVGMIRRTTDDFILNAQDDATTVSS